jgi:DNA replication protein DnaC
VTANLSLDEIAARFPDPFGDAIASRLAQHCETFELTGADRRLVRFAA